MTPKSGNRFSDQVMLKEGYRVNGYALSSCRVAV